MGLALLCTSCGQRVFLALMSGLLFSCLGFDRQSLLDRKLLFKLKDRFYFVTFCRGELNSLKYQENNEIVESFMTKKHKINRHIPPFCQKMRPIYQYYYLFNIWNKSYYFKHINHLVYYAIIVRDFTYFISIIRIIIVQIFIYFEARACIL